MPRVLELALAALSLLWAWTAKLVADRAAEGISGRLGWVYGQRLLQSLFLLFLAVVGFRALDWMATQGSGRREILALPRRGSAGEEWGSGFAIGWGLCLAAVLPVLLSGHLHAFWSRGPGLVQGIVAAVATLLAASLAEEVIFRGYPFIRLVRGLGATAASVLMSLLFAVILVAASPPSGFGLALVDGTLFGLVLAMAYLRTHALWLGWGLHFGYRAVMAVVIGLPIVGLDDFGSVLDTRAAGPRWLSGGAYGLDAALLTAGVMLAGMAVVYRMSRAWAWAYTTPEIVAAGYAVEVAPPAAHASMEKAAAAETRSLVQILPATSQTFSAGDPE